ncbi:hypothetical protein SEUCBS139899_002668 [Sporothrix eucalyptigena]|uniref:RRM domain-containing protein n=1 Tax=Sporothrix eucalyptigena TaxID=1812306 RepID=A0ABP0AXP4_9PEZI
MWPSPTSLPPAPLGPRQQTMTASVPAYEPSRHGSSISSAGDALESKTSIWRYPCPFDTKTDTKLADLWPRQVNGTSPSAWLDDYYNSAVADDNDDDDDGDDSIFLPMIHQNQQYQQQPKNQQEQPHSLHQRQNSIVQFTPWLPTTVDNAADTTVDSQPTPLAHRSSRLSQPSASFHYLSAQQKAAQLMALQNERMLRSQMDMYQIHQAHHERFASFSSNMVSVSYPRGQNHAEVPVPVHRGSLPMASPSVTATMDATATLSIAGSSPRQACLSPKDNSCLFSPTFQFQEPLPSPDQDGQKVKQPQKQQQTPASSTPTKTFKPMQMVFREGRRASASSTSTSTSSGTGTGTATTAATADTALSDTLVYPQMSAARRMSSASTSASVSGHYPPSLCLPMHASPSPPPYLASLASLASQDSPLPLHEQVFRRQQGISLNYRGDIHNPHNRGDHVPAHLNTSLFLMGLPPQATVGDLLRAVAALGPTGRVFAASVNPPDPARRLPLAAAKISFFTRQQAERLKSQIDAGQLVMWDISGASSGSRSLTIRCAWNRDKKPPRQCVQANECRVLRIRGPADVVNFEALTAYFDEKFRYELQDIKVVGGGTTANAGEQTMEWRFASFQSQAIAAKMALNQERKMVRVEYGRDPCEWGEC